MKKSLLQILAVFKKELKSELRSKIGISTILLFVMTTITMIVFTTAGLKLKEGVVAGLLWIIMFFTAMISISRSFVSEEERGTGLLLQLISTSSSVFLGKLLFNICLSFITSIAILLLYFIFNDSVKIRTPEIFWLSMVLGSLGISSCTTIISAIISKSSSKSALFPILSFPILLPVIMIGVNSTKLGLEGWEFSRSIEDFNIMFGYIGILTTVSFFLFDYVWKD